MSGILLIIGIGWGATQPLAKIAVTGGHGPIGLVFWQLLIGGVLLSIVNRLRGYRLRRDARALRLYAFIALVGTILPNTASYTAAFHLPAGIMSIVIATVPMMAFPMALALGTDRFSTRRTVGLLLGISGVGLIALPGTALPDPAMVAFLPLALIAPFLYAVEGNYVDRWGTDGLDAIQLLQGASLIGCVIALPIALGTGNFVALDTTWGREEWALMALSVIHALVYSGYVWLVGRAGAVFAAQVSYLVTGFGVVWAMILLSERYSILVWAAMAVILAGVALVQPRDRGEAG
ncbi:DMT family transporter [Ponticoccus sp. SC2-23]|nr:DMT family transporter [Ponticoccus sp. SC6-9]MBM1223229.1 DMT family transporter [Ponticoccus sp. SC6-15]MBM1229512.1 DMT family transporter [Ponticoccus sp. SC6-38]MBM1232195.1 DMT family transporter [Ponticoccus sp. SC6-45]MBM1237855.1 DMT family transporter [Ponticoccus sp. SC6-49]MBM1241206.1 DMT family transporter [Ponticoccus sp. SC2-64]MBM1245719.1 DMT family transporter [Ponticoccus sp. SC6-42]MBM1250197.1 DMT family transporter [Ponticoccus sp. SC6-33]MBM1255864.1 DMT family tr